MPGAALPGLRAESAFAFSTCWGEVSSQGRAPQASPACSPPAPALTHEDNDADGAQDPRTDESSNPKAVPIWEKVRGDLKANPGPFYPSPPAT